MAPPKFRTWTIVFHNVLENSKPQFKDRFSRVFNIKRVLLAEELYNHTPGQHLHVFMETQNQISFKSCLSKLEGLKLGLVEEGEFEFEGTISKKGRVQLDRMRGTFEQATAYLQGETKEKKIDEDITDVKISEKVLRLKKFYEDNIKYFQKHLEMNEKFGEWNDAAKEAHFQRTGFKSSNFGRMLNKDCHRLIDINKDHLKKLLKEFPLN